MGVSYGPQSIQGESSEYLLNLPFEAYTDSPTLRLEDKIDGVPRDQPQVGPSTWRKLTSWISRSNVHLYSLLRQGPDKSKSPFKEKAKPCRSCCWRLFLRTLLVFFVMLGVIQFISLSFGIALSFFPDEYDRAASAWKHDSADPIDNNASHWPAASRDIIAVNCHSHNDYWRKIPLFSALQAGCVSVEADVWLFDEELYVGHTTSSLTSRRTLRSLYIDPLVEILNQQNQNQNPTTTQQRLAPPRGVFDSDPHQSVVLLIDFKTDGATTWPAVAEELAPLRDRGYLTYFNGDSIVPGPVTVVGTGNAPFNLVTANSTYRDIFFDAPLEKLLDEDEDEDGNDTRPSETGSGQGHTGMPDTLRANTFNVTNSYYASVSFKKAVGFPWPFHFTQRQVRVIREQVRVAHRLGLKVRYWSIPGWPVSLRNHVWRILVQEGVDMLNVDDLVTATKGDWKIPVFDWWV